MIDVITGTGRSGTKYVSTLLNHVCILGRVPRRCTHETVFSNTGMRVGKQSVLEASWLAVPYLPLPDSRVVHLVRNPTDVFASLLGISMFDQSIPIHWEYQQFMRKHWRQWEGNTVDVAAEFIVEWNEKVEWEDTDLRMKVEDLGEVENLRCVTQLFGIDVADSVLVRAIEMVPTNVNSRRRANLTNYPIPRQLIELGKRYGY